MSLATCSPKKVACVAIVLLVVCTMLAMDNLYLETYQVLRPARFLQPAALDVVRPGMQSSNVVGVNVYEFMANSSSSSKPAIDQSNSSGEGSDLVVLNNFGGNINLPLRADRQREAPASELKHILHWNEAYGDKKYAFGLGREPFYTHRCPETRCVTTDDRGSRPLEDFAAIIFHERSLSWSDIPNRANRRPDQRYVHFIAESAQYIYNDIPSMGGFFNWSMCNKRDADIWRPDGRIIQLKAHPEGQDLKDFILEFGRSHRHLAEGKSMMAAWFVSNCHTPGGRERLVKQLQQQHNLTVDIYGQCGSLQCPRSKGGECYTHVEQNYKFYLSFENSVCADYVTEKFYNAMKYNVIPVTYNGADMAVYGPPHSFINALDFESAAALAEYLLQVSSDPALYASYFWWKDFYEVRNSDSDKAQAFCELCAALHADRPAKVIADLNAWWVTDSHCQLPDLAYSNR